MGRASPAPTVVIPCTGIIVISHGYNRTTVPEER